MKRVFRAFDWMIIVLVPGLALIDVIVKGEWNYALGAIGGYALTLSLQALFGKADK
jgi:hypothetical protein